MSHPPGAAPAHDPAQAPPPNRGRGVARSASIVSLAVFSSRILGLVREQVMAALFGAGLVNDAFVVAFRVPNLFRDLLAEGALSSAFVKTFAGKLEKDGASAAWRLASQVFNALGLAVAALCLAGMAAAPWLVSALAPDFQGEKAALTIELTRLLFPFLLMVALAAVAMGALNARNVFGVPAMASTFFNAGSIAVGVLACYVLEPGFVTSTARAILAGTPPVRDAAVEQHAIFGMAAGVLAGGLLQLGCQLPSLRAQGFRWSPRLDPSDPGLREVLRLMAPAVIGAAAVQVNVFVNTNFASRLEDGSVSALNYAFRLMQFPIGVFGVAIATATLPAISRSAARKDREGYRDTLAESLRLALFLTVPSAVGLAVLGTPIIALIYQHGNFTAADTELTAGALRCYAIGLVGYSLIKILAPAFYAVDDARTPARISVLSIAVNLGLCWLLVDRLAVRGLALSTATVATANALLLFLLLRRRVGPLKGGELLAATIKIGAASALLAAAAYAARVGLESAVGTNGTLARCVVVFGAMAAGGAVFLAAAYFLRLEEMARVRSLLARRRGR